MAFTEVRFVQPATTELYLADAGEGMVWQHKLSDKGKDEARRLGSVWRDEGIEQVAFHTSKEGGGLETLTIATGEVGLNPKILIKTELEGGLSTYSLASEPVLRATVQLVDYLTSLHQGPESSESIVAMADDIMVRGLLSYVEMGGVLAQANVDAKDLLRRMVARDPLEPCTQSCVVLEGGPAPGELRVSIDYAGEALWAAEA